MWVDVGRRDVRLAGGIDTLDVASQQQQVRCSMPGCQRPGEHEGMCGRHFWRATAYERDQHSAQTTVIARCELPPRYERLAEAYLLAADALARLPAHRWVLLWRAMNVTPQVLRRVRTIITIAAGLPGAGIAVDADTQYRVMVTDRDAALLALEHAALSTHYWRQAVSALLAAETALR